MKETIYIDVVKPWDEQPEDVKAYDAEEQRISTEFVLTDEHAAVSYGMPVLVAPDGTVYGAKDCIKGARDAAAEVRYYYGSEDMTPLAEKFYSLY